MAKYIFLGAFYSVALVVIATLVSAFLRSRRALGRGEAGRIRWHSDFHELPAADRVCRHVLTGEFQSRQCPNAFDCRQCGTHAALKSGGPAGPPSQDEDLFGMNFPADRFYHRGHAWARPEADGTVTVGLDELGRRLLGAPDSVVLPQPGAQVRVNGTAFRVCKRDADVRVLSPVDGEVLETGGADCGYFVRVKPAGGFCDVRHLLSGSEVRPWMMRELERLQLTLSVKGAPATLADGGVLVADIAASYPDASWDAVCGEMFLEP